MRRPWFKKPTLNVSFRMKRVRSAHTQLEKAMAKLLNQLSIKHTKQLKILGKPDFKVNNSNTLIFCDSAFWHGRRTKEITGEAFRKNKAFWVNKLKENRRRDLRITRSLRKSGWHVMRFWDTDILKSPEKVIKRLRKEIVERNA